MSPEFLKLLERKTARGSVGPSTARGMGPKGTIAAARLYLEGYDLRRIKARSEKTFQLNLDEATDELKYSLPTGARHWGSARKFFNIFLRGALYNRYTCEKYGLIGLEPWLEVPLDSHVAKGLLIEPEGKSLPKWKTVIGLTQDVSLAYQIVARDVATRKKTERVHLDLLYWRGDHMANTALQGTRHKRRAPEL
ncbi:MAG: hypothetical protein RL297_2023 [Pseudomonadota bacterium]|jgi:hypothetical protein